MDGASSSLSDCSFLPACTTARWVLSLDWVLSLFFNDNEDGLREGLAKNVSESELSSSLWRCNAGGVPVIVKVQYIR